MFVCPECGAAAPVAGSCTADGTPLAPVGEDLLLGTTIGVYRVARLLGIGGMGRVYKGVHPAIGSRVAIKVLSRECSDRRDLVDRFFAEAKAVNLIRHESIVNVLDLATLPDGRPYIIMEYLDGAPLQSLVEHAVAVQAPLPLGGIARLVADVLDALGAAHAKGIVHRDLKPDNIFVAPSGRPKILDFGIAKLSDVTNTSTRTGSLLGTPHYMSPEQAAGRAVDLRADVYAMGVILFECTTGRKPFLAEALFDLLRMQVEAPPPSPRALRPDMPLELEQVILTALAKAPDHRFANAAAMSMALQHATVHLGADQWRPLTPPSAHAPSPSWAPTPPSSWSGGGSPTPVARPQGMQAQQAPAMPPPAQQQMNLGHLTTLSAGQVTHGQAAAKPRPSRRGLWIALGAAVVVGGVATAAVLVGGSKPAPVATNEPVKPSEHTPPSEPAKPAGEPPGGDPWANKPAAGSAAAAEPPPAAHDDDAHAAAHDDDAHAADGDNDEDDARPSAGKDAKPSHASPDAAFDDQLTTALAQLDATIKSLPPAQQKQLAAYRGLAKLPPKERMKRLRELTKTGGLGIPDLSALTHIPEPPAIPDPPAEPPAIPEPPRTTAWVTNTTIDPPPGFDPQRADVSAFVAWSIGQARKAIPDAQLIRIDADGVSADGRANLTLATLASNHGSIDVRFISPSRGKRDPSQPLGVARHDFKCEFRVMAEPSGVELMPIDFADCTKEHVVAVPRCSAGGVWKKAIARKAPSQNAVGNLGYRSNGAKAVWYFDIGFGRDVVFSDTFGDDC